MRLTLVHRRLLVCSACAFGLALIVRQVALTRIESRLAPWVSQLAAISSVLAPAARLDPVMEPALLDAPTTGSTAREISETAVPMTSASISAPQIASQSSLRTASKPPRGNARSHASVPEAKRANHVIVTSAQLADAMRHGVPGASVTLRRDAQGRPLGLALHGVSALSRFGVRDGDLLITANGLPLRTGNEALRTLGAVSQANTVVVQLLRNGSPVFITVDLVP